MVVVDVLADMVASLLFASLVSLHLMILGWLQFVVDSLDAA